MYLLGEQYMFNMYLQGKMTCVGTRDEGRECSLLNILVMTSRGETSGRHLGRGG